ncbi:MAG: hypothetical protein AAF492_17420, partial [Verrucomicrobiota bacterium]
PFLKPYGVDIVFQGHNHWYERMHQINDVYYITTGSGGRPLSPVASPEAYTACVNDTDFCFTLLIVSEDEMYMKQINADNEVIDSYIFRLSDTNRFQLEGVLDDPGWSVANNSGLNLYAAIRGDDLYLATEDAGGGDDHFIYFSYFEEDLVPANWSKSGQVMGWSAFLADENNNLHHGWYDAADITLKTQSLFRSYVHPNGNGVLEGTVNIEQHLGFFPQTIRVAVGAFDTGNGGVLSAQVPAGDANGNIDADEFLELRVRDIIKDPLIIDTGGNMTNEVGIPFTFDAGGSVSPSERPLHYVWLQLDGPMADFDNFLGEATGVAFNDPVVETTNVNFMLLVSDGRMVETGLVTVTVTPTIDTDGDGLSDGEERTGMDSPFTTLSPNGHLTDTNQVDTDGDGMSDGEEAVAGTVPTNSFSFLELNIERTPENSILLKWDSYSNRNYSISTSTNLFTPFQPMATGLPAQVPMNIYTSPITGYYKLFFKLDVTLE